VVIPNFNDGHYIARCLDSILNQEVLPDEVVVVDDCSTDNSVEIILSLLQGREKVTFIQSPKNLGVYGALELGASHTSGNYLMFVAANDFVLPGVFAHAKRCLSLHPGVGLWSSMGWLVDEKDRPIRALALAVPSLKDRYFSPEESLRLAQRLGNWFAGPTVVYNRETYEAVGRFNPTLRGLADLVCALQVAVKRGATFSPVPYAAFRLHEGSYLAETLVKPEVFLPLLQEIAAIGQRTSPELFTDEFTERTIRRFVFTAVRASGGKQLPKYTAVLRISLARRLLHIDHLVSKRYGRLRIALAFLLLRPFDIWPSLFNRLCGTAFVAIRERNRVNLALSAEKSSYARHYS
jgi:glycosyltransferase involved in cell wall biosynthesis